MLSGCRSNATFGRIGEFELDERDLCPANEWVGRWRNTRLDEPDAPWQIGDGKEVLGIFNSGLQPATLEDLARDAADWRLPVARHARAQQTQKNMHGCQKACTKYADPGENAKKAANRAQASVCCFFFFMIQPVRGLRNIKDRADPEMS